LDVKPLCHIFEEIVSVENLFRAAEATLRHGRRFRGEGAGFKFNLEKEVLKLHEQLAAGRYRHGRYRLFTVQPLILAFMFAHRYAFFKSRTRGLPDDAG